MLGPVAPAMPLTIAIFASDRGSGDAERASLMSQAGSFLARKGARIVCAVEGDDLPVPLVTSARSAGGEVLILSDGEAALPPALAEVPVEVIPEAAARLARLVGLADALVGMPGSLASARSLFGAWTRAGGQGKPVVLLNRNGAFEVLRGFAADVLSHSLRDHDRKMQFADSVEDLWNRLHRIGEGRGR